VLLDAVHVAEDAAVLALVRVRPRLAARAERLRRRLLRLCDPVQRPIGRAAAAAEHLQQEVDHDPGEPEPAAAHCEAAATAEAAAVGHLTRIEPRSWAKPHRASLPPRRNRKRTHVPY